MACGLKCKQGLFAGRRERHATYVACGLKCFVNYGFLRVFASCHVCGMWIEIVRGWKLFRAIPSCHVCGMWIEIQQLVEIKIDQQSCHVCGMWIEMDYGHRNPKHQERHATYVACGLK